jgi:hypothetical protein
MSGDSDLGRIEPTPAKIVFVEYGFSDGVRRSLMPTDIVRVIELNGNDCPTAEIGASPLPSRRVELDPNFKIGMLHDLILTV